MQDHDFKEIVERVRTASDIVDVISSYVPLTRAGAKFKALSPFQQEKTPSFYVDPGKQLFKCFSSGHGGDVFKFVQIYENLDFMGALRRLAERARIDLPESGTLRSSPESRSEREQLLALHEVLAAWWSQLLHEDAAAQPARDYLASRDFPLELATQFGLGYAPDSWDATLAYARKKRFPDSLLITAGIAKARSSGLGAYDFFRGRLMIPICNEQGKVVAFSGRLLDPAAKESKYVNSPETPIFSKSRILFGLDKTKKGIVEAGHALLCEGQLDLMRLYHSGFTNAVAPQGTAFTEQHAALLKRFTSTVVICFDSDRAGIKASLRSIALLIAAGLDVRVVTLPAGHDPDSLLRQPSGATQLRELLKEPPPYYLYQLEQVCATHSLSNPTSRSQAVQQMAELLALVTNGTQHAVIKQHIASRLLVPPRTVEEAVESVRKQQSRHPVPRAPESRPTQPPTRPEDSSADAANKDARPFEETPVAKPEELAAERPLPAVSDLIHLILTHPHLVPHVQRHLHHQWLELAPGGTVLELLLSHHLHDLWEDIPHFIDQLSPVHRNTVTGLLMNPLELPEENTLEEFTEERVESIGRWWREQRIAVLDQQIKSGLLQGTALMQATIELLDLRRGGT